MCAESKARTAREPHPAAEEQRPPSARDAGAFGAPMGETRIDTASGLSGDKGVHSVGNSLTPTSRGAGNMRPGTPSVGGVSDEIREHTLQEQLRQKGFASQDANSRKQR